MIKIKMNRDYRTCLSESFLISRKKSSLENNLYPIKIKKITYTKFIKAQTN